MDKLEKNKKIFKTYLKIVKEKEVPLKPSLVKELENELILSRLTLKFTMHIEVRKPMRNATIQFLPVSSLSSGDLENLSQIQRYYHYNDIFELFKTLMRQGAQINQSDLNLAKSGESNLYNVT